MAPRVSLLSPVLALSVAAMTRISCIGDSITAGVCADKPGGYPPLLQDLLGTTDYLVTNYGVSAMTQLKKGLCGPPPGGDCSYWDTGADGWKGALASSPDVVTILLGTNDAKNFNWGGVQSSTGDSYALDYIDMVKMLKALPTQPKVYLMVPPPLYPPFPYDMNKTVINSGFPSLIRELAAATGADGVIDLFNALGGANLTMPNITCDGCHPRQAGYALIAQTMASVLAPSAKLHPLSEAASGVLGGGPGSQLLQREEERVWSRERLRAIVSGEESTSTLQSAQHAGDTDGTVA